MIMLLDCNSWKYYNYKISLKANWYDKTLLLEYEINVTFCYFPFRTLSTFIIDISKTIKLEIDIVGGMFQLNVSWIYFSHAKTSSLWLNDLVTDIFGF